MCKPIVILGGCGFLGTNINHILNYSNIINLSRQNGYDILDSNFTEKLSEINPGVVINCAVNMGSLSYVSSNSADLLKTNMQILLNVYESVKQFGENIVVINPISNCTYPEKSTVQIEKEWHNGCLHDSVIGYASAKKMIYDISYCYNKQYKVGSINWILPNMYGIYDHADEERTHALNGLIIRMLKAQKARKTEFEIRGTGTPIREWLNVEDAAKIFIQSITSKHSQIAPINVAQNTGHSIKDIALMISSALNYSPEFVYNTNYGDGQKIKIMDDKLFKKLYPKFKFTPIEQGIKKTIEYYQGIIT